MDRGIPTEATLATMREGDAPVHYLVGCSSDIDSSCGTFAGKRHHVVGDDDVLRIGLGEQCPRLVEA